MISYEYRGGCHCGNIAFEAILTRRPDSYNPRACDRNFCRARAASYISDRHGKLIIRVKDETNLSRYRQGSGIADSLICNTCGVLVGISYYEDGGPLYAAVNSRTIENADFGTEISVSPKSLNDQDKVQRWKDAWFSDVSIRGVGA